MPNTVIFVLSVEGALILLTTLLLAQPRLLFHSSQGRTHVWARWGGIALLVLTFCWSVIAGIVLSINGFSLRF